MVQVVTTVRRVLVQCLFPKYVIDARSLIYYLLGGVRNVGLTEDSRLLTEQAERYRSLATEAEKENAVLKETIKQEQDKVQRLELRYDKEHDWALMRIEEEKDSHRQQTQQEIQHLQAETIRSKQAVDLMQAKFDMLSRQQEVNRDRISELESSLSDEKLKLSEQILQAAHLQKELNDKNERIRLLGTKQNKRTK